MVNPSPDWESRIGRRLKLRDLHILFTVVQWGSMAKGASHLGMSQPAVSEAIASLEDALGVRLLDRSPRGIEPTVYAHALLKRRHIVFDELKQGIRDIQFLADPTVGEVRVGCPESMAAGFLPAVIDRMAHQHPQITVHVVVAQTGEQEFRELRERSVDVMLGRLLRPLPDEEMAIEVLCKDKFFVVTGARSPWATRRKVALSELSAERWILFPTDSLSGEHIAEAFRTEGVPLPQKCVTTFSLQTRMHLLATGRYFTVLQGSVLEFNSKRWLLKSLPIDLPLPPAPIAIFALKSRTLSAVVQLFIEHVREVTKAMIKNSEHFRSAAASRDKPSH
jgi:DNA-binding transcriptional LysR family regulator